MRILLLVGFLSFLSPAVVLACDCDKKGAQACEASKCEHGEACKGAACKKGEISKSLNTAKKDLKKSYKVKTENIETPTEPATTN